VQKDTRRQEVLGIFGSVLDYGGESSSEREAKMGKTQHVTLK
jgi:hypothetical protein